MLHHINAVLRVIAKKRHDEDIRAAMVGIIITELGTHKDLNKATAHIMNQSVRV
jgi:hypothetical protein